MENDDFNDSLSGTWKVKNAGTPPKIFTACPTIDDCRVRFDGVAKGKISQTVVIDSSQVKLVVGDTLWMTVSINSTPASGSDVKYSVQVNYSDGTPAAKATGKVHVTYTSEASTYLVANPAMLDLASKAVASIKLTVSSPKATDTFSVGSVGLSLNAGSYRSDSGALPLPVGDTYAI